ncbi:dUTP diphosphatase [Methylomonas sp. AM2-LC]|uniref:dUTP diphosphatase n=1 Tax=Methylomonas sp. AM2-LC TaxID=3153301 RepID=UPI00326519A3
MKLKIQTKILNSKIGTDFPLPVFATDGSAGMDLRACIDSAITIPAGETVMIATGIAIYIADPGIMAVLAPRSGLSFKHAIGLKNFIGIVDSDYQNEICIAVWNHGTQAYTIQPGDRICQMMFVPVIQPSLEIVTEFSDESQRGLGGWGHSGIQ